MFCHGIIFDKLYKRCLDSDESTWSTVCDKKCCVFFFLDSWGVYEKREQENIFKNGFSLASCMKAGAHH